mmetsp:Transcript_8779/g.21716  ORF Transcript_8779/g.21716 Transcript_8779/m.21716 type:complete len:202 (-) Transcript_8779:57-662(-)
MFYTFLKQASTLTKGEGRPANTGMDGSKQRAEGHTTSRVEVPQVLPGSGGFRGLGVFQFVEHNFEAVDAHARVVFLERLFDAVGVGLLLPPELGLDLLPLPLGEELLNQAKVRAKLLQRLVKSFRVLLRPLLRCQVARVAEGAQLVPGFFDAPLRPHQGLHLGLDGEGLPVDNNLAVHHLHLRRDRPVLAARGRPLPARLE